MLKTNKVMQQTLRMFSYNYSSAQHSRVYMDVTKDGQSAGRLVFELFDTHAPTLAENFAAFCTGQADGQRSFVGTTFDKGSTGLGIFGGDLHEEDNWGANNMRLADENLEVKHHKRGMLSMTNNGSH